MPNPKDPHADREARKYESPIASREFILEQLDKANSPLGFSDLIKLCKVQTEDLKVALDFHSFAPLIF